MKKQCEKRNLSMVMDFYEMTMANGYYLNADCSTKVAFDVFYRKNPDNGGYSIFAGLEQIIEYIQNLHFEKEDIDYLKTLNMFSDDFLEYLENFKFTGDMYAFPEGTIMYPNEPIITVVAPLIDAQLIETAILLEVNHQSLIATKASRIVRSANGRTVSDFGARRAHNMDSAVYGARASYIGGVKSTATVLAGQMFNIPIGGTMAHSWVMFFKNEYTAFKKYAEIYPNNCTLLVDTYDVLNSGVPNAIKVFQEMKDAGIKGKLGIRLDSGDLAYLSKEARKMLDEAGFKEAKIVVSNSLDEYTIRSLINQGAEIDAFGVGERLITSKSEPVFGAVYKIVAVDEKGEFVPRIKISENAEKITNPGLKKVYRVFNKEGVGIADIIGLYDEKVTSSDVFVDPKRPWVKETFNNCKIKELQVPIFKNGELVYKLPTLQEIADYTKDQLKKVWEEELRFENPHVHYMDMTKNLYNKKMEMLNQKEK